MALQYEQDKKNGMMLLQSMFRLPTILKIQFKIGNSNKWR